MSAIAYECGVAGLGTGPNVPLAELDLREHTAGLGWSGWGRVRQADRSSAAALFARAQAHGLVPGAPVVLSLSPAGRDPARTWPSILTELEVRSGADAPPAVFVRFADPLTHLAARPLYGVFTDCTPGGILAGSLARAAAATAEPGALRVAHPSLPILDIRERAWEKGGRIAYAIAGGEPLLAFVRRVLDETGVRLAVRGLASGTIRLDLTDDAEERGRNADGAVRLAASFEPRTAPGTLVVRGLCAAVGSGRPPAEVRRAQRSDGARASGWVARAHAVSEEPGLRAGGRVELTRGAVADTRTWRVVSVTHRLADRGYANECLLESPGSSQDCEPASHHRAPRTLTGTVHEAGSSDGDVVPVDARGRIPVRLVCDERAVVRLPFVVPAAGGVHGFAPACCEGDRVRVLVHGPFRAEVRGALWSEALTPDEEARGAALAVHVAPGLGVAFNAADRIAELAS